MKSIKMHLEENGLIDGKNGFSIQHKQKISDGVKRNWMKRRSEKVI